MSPKSSGELPQTSEDIGEAHYQMGSGVGAFGNRVALVGASEPGLGTS